MPAGNPAAYLGGGSRRRNPGSASVPQGAMDTARRFLDTTPTRRAPAVSGLGAQLAPNVPAFAATPVGQNLLAQVLRRYGGGGATSRGGRGMPNRRVRGTPARNVRRMRG